MELQGGAMLGFFIPWLANWFPKLVGWDAYLKDANKVFEFWRKFAKQRIQSYENKEEHEKVCFVDLYIKKIKECKTITSSFYGQKGGTKNKHTFFCIMHETHFSYMIKKSFHRTFTRCNFTRFIHCR